MDEVLRLAVRDIDPAHAAKSPDEQLLEEVTRSSQIVEWLALRVAELRVPDPSEEGNPFADLMGVNPETGEPIMEPNRYVLWGPDHTGDAAPHIYWAMLNQERDRHAKLCKMAIDAGISERLVRIAEAQGIAIVAVILRVLNRLHLEPDKLEEAKRYAAQELRALGPGGTPTVIDVD